MPGVANCVTSPALYSLIPAALLIVSAPVTLTKLLPEPLNCQLEIDPLFSVTAPIYAAATAANPMEDTGAVCAVLEALANYRRP